MGKTAFLPTRSCQRQAPFRRGSYCPRGLAGSCRARTTASWISAGQAEQKERDALKETMEARTSLDILLAGACVS